MGVPTEYWQQVIYAEDQARAFREHFAAIAETDECKQILHDLSQLLTSSLIVGDSLVFELGKRRWISGSAPLISDELDGLPPSYRRVVGLHNGLTFPSDDGYYLVGFHDGYIPSNFTEEFWSPHNNDPNIDPNDLVSPIECQSNFLIWHPTAKTRSGEPALAILDHENGELAAPLSLELGVGGVFLRLVGEFLLPNDPRCEGFCF